jgi:hypothetical protein
VRGAASLMPRRCPSAGPKPLEALLDCVLDRLGALFECVEEPLEAMDVWRRGEGDAVECPSLVRGVYEE